MFVSLLYRCCCVAKLLLYFYIKTILLDIERCFYLLMQNRKLIRVVYPAELIRVGSVWYMKVLCIIPVIRILTLNIGFSE